MQRNEADFGCLEENLVPHPVTTDPTSQPSNMHVIFTPSENRYVPTISAVLFGLWCVAKIATQKHDLPIIGTLTIALEIIWLNVPYSGALQRLWTSY